MQRPDFHRKAMEIEVKSVAGITPHEILDKKMKPLKSKSREKEMIERVFNKKLKNVVKKKERDDFKLLLNRTNGIKTSIHNFGVRFVV